MGMTSSTQIANAFDENAWVKVSGDRFSVGPWKMDNGDKNILTGSTSQTSDPSSSPGAFLSLGPIVEEKSTVKINSNTSKGQRQLDWNKIETQFQIVQPGRCLRFDVPVSPRRPTVYITIVTASGRVMLDALPKMEDISLIVTARGEIRNADHSKVWIDRQGQRH